MKKEKNNKVLHSKYGDFNLARESDRKRLKKTVVQLQRQTDALTRKDMGDWRNAWQMAINVDYPNRQRLYDIYRDVDVDLHLSGCILQREGFVLARSFKLLSWLMKREMRMRKQPASLQSPGSSNSCIMRSTLTIGVTRSLSWAIWLLTLTGGLPIAA